MMHQAIKKNITFLKRNIIISWGKMYILTKPAHCLSILEKLLSAKPNDLVSPTCRNILETGNDIIERTPTDPRFFFCFFNWPFL